MNNQTQGAKSTKKSGVDRDKCIGCGLCARIAPGTFVTEGGKSTVVEKPTDTQEKIQEAVEGCPVSAIS